MNIATDILKLFLTASAVALAEKKEREQKQKKLNDALPFTDYEIVNPKLPQHAENIND